MRWKSVALVSMTVAGAAVCVGHEPADAAAGISTGAALQAALDSGARYIRLAPLARIRLTAGLTHTLPGRVTIKGRKATIDARFAGDDAIVFSGGGNVTLEDMSIINGPNRGVVVSLPPGSTGFTTLRMRRMTVRRFAELGVHMDDNGTDASLQVDLRDVKLLNNGDDRAADPDGLRVNESGPGHVFGRFLRVVVEANKRDGISLVEEDDGHVRCNVYHAKFIRNGTLRAPGDGFDIDESGAGNVDVQVRNSISKSNFEDGVDVDEADDGDCIVRLGNIHFSVNRDDGIDVDESGNGRLIANLLNVTANDNFEDGLDLDESDAGDLLLNHTHGTHHDNHDDGVDLDQSGAGQGMARFRRVRFKRNRDENISATGVTVYRR